MTLNPSCDIPSCRGSTSSVCSGSGPLLGRVDSDDRGTVCRKTDLVPRPTSLRYSGAFWVAHAAGLSGVSPRSGLRIARAHRPEAYAIGLSGVPPRSGLRRARRRSRGLRHRALAGVVPVGASNRSRPPSRGSRRRALWCVAPFGASEDSTKIPRLTLSGSLVCRPVRGFGGLARVRAICYLRVAG